MSGIEGIGRILMVFGGIILLLGLAFTLAGRIPLLGRLPGDIFIQRDNVTVFFPLATMIVLSILLTILLNVLPRLFR